MITLLEVLVGGGCFCIGVASGMLLMQSHLDRLYEKASDHLDEELSHFKSDMEERFKLACLAVDVDMKDVERSMDFTHSDKPGTTERKE